MELALHEIGRGRCIDIALGHGDPLPAAHAAKPVSLHQTGDTFLADAVPFVAQILEDIRCAVGGLGARVIVADAHRQLGIANRTRRGLASLPGVITALRHTKHSTHRAHRKLGLNRDHEFVDPLDVLSPLPANQAVAFARMSRSSCFARYSRTRAAARRACARPSPVRLSVVGIAPRTTASLLALWTAFPSRLRCPRKRVNSRSFDLRQLNEGFLSLMHATVTSIPA